ncbi:MAG TPA: glycosyltransferase family 39 protein [Stellaceae bacterium]|nr:glycosyltransferase family 39 protein [Stellaceae bacterium]
MMAQALLGWRPYALLLLLCLGLYLPGFASLPVTDRDEARFAQASRQMLETGDYVNIRFQDEARNKKPAGIYWLQAAAVSVLSDAKSAAIWPYRVPSLLGATIAALMTFGMGSAVVGRKGAFLGAALLAASIELVVEAHLAKTDAVLLACITAAQLALARLYLAARQGAQADWRIALLFWLALAFGILVKGPVGPAVSALTIILLGIADREWRWLKALRPARGLALLIVMVAPWLIAISTTTEGAFLSQSLGSDFLGKLIGSQESHGAPPLLYLVTLAIAFWPGVLFLGPAIAWAWKHRSDGPERFLIAWAVPFWIVLELVPTKLPNYLLPAYPALALMIGRALVAAADGAFASWRWLDRGVAVIWAAASLGLAAVLVLTPMQFGNGDASGLVAAAILLFLATRIGFAFWRGAAAFLVPRTIILALLVLPLGFAFVAPQLDRLWLSRAAAELVARNAPAQDAPVVAAAGYAEPSLVFLLGTRTMLVDPGRAAAHVAAVPGALALVESRSDAAFRADLAVQGKVPRVLGKVSGLDYSNGRPMILTLYGGAQR